MIRLLHSNKETNVSKRTRNYHRGIASMPGKQGVAACIGDETEMSTTNKDVEDDAVDGDKKKSRERVVILRSLDGIAYVDHKVQNNTLLHLKDLGTHNRRVWFWSKKQTGGRLY